jgi:predicted nuclease of restriction endonuclease-like RecB superfamily
MLTADLVRARVRGPALEPTFIDPERAELLTFAEAAIDVVARAVEEGGTRGEVDAAITDLIGSSRSLKVMQGIAKILLDRAESDTDAPRPPAELRDLVFRRARARGPLSLTGGDALGRASARDVLTEVAAEVGLTPDALASFLYADLPSAQVVRSWRALDATALLHRYNVAQVQALLLRAAEVRVVLDKPSPGRVRQLLRHARFHQLLFRASRADESLELVFDGPTSLFSQSSRYGMQLAMFFPALLLQDGAWRLVAEVPWARNIHPKRLEITHEHDLVGHLSDTGAYTPREVGWFAERWAAVAPGSKWTMTESTTPIELGGRGVVLPDFTFTDGKRTAHLEIVGFWRKDWLERRLEGLRRHGPGNMVLAVSSKLHVGEHALDEFPGEVIGFSQVVPVKDVLAAIERVAK